jgi:hypothetical protein
MMTSELVLPGKKSAQIIFGNEGFAMAMTGAKSGIRHHDEGPKY